MCLTLINAATRGQSWLLERFRVTFNGKRESVSRDQIFLYLSFTVHYFYTKISIFMLVLTMQIALD